MLRYIPDPTERFLDGDFQPAPGKQGLKVMPGPRLAVTSVLNSLTLATSSKFTGKFFLCFNYVHVDHQILTITNQYLPGVGRRGRKVQLGLYFT